MTDLKIKIYQQGESDPKTTITIPGGVLRVASKLIPKKAAEAMQEKGVDLDEIIKIAENPDVQGTLMEIVEHDKNERIVIALE